MMRVTVLLISNKHGTDVYVYEGFDMAYRRLGQYVDEWWDRSMMGTIFGGERAVPLKPSGIDEKICYYFSTMDNRESYKFFDAEIICAEPESDDGVLSP